MANKKIVRVRARRGLAAGVRKTAKAKPSEELTELLRRGGPMLSSAVARRFEAKGVAPAAARQRTSRLPSDTAALKGVSFPKRARFIYHKDDLGTSQYFRALEKALREHNPPLASALNALEARGGVIPLRQFIIASGCPVRQKNQVSAERALMQLVSCGLVRKVEVEGIGTCLVTGGLGGMDEGFKETRANMMAEGFLLDAIAAWLGRMNMVSPQAVAIRGGDKNPQFATFEFDLCGPSYLAPLKQFKGDRMQTGFMVADVILGHELNLQDVSPFLRKCTLLNNLRGRMPYLPMLIGDAFTAEALHECRAAGIMVTRPETLFGRDVSMALGSLMEVLSATAVAPADRLQSIFRKLGSIEGAAGNLRGALFEMVTCHLVTELEGGSANVGVLLHEQQSGKRAEADVLLRKQRQISAYECKGHQSSSRTKLDEVEHWLNDRVPVMYKALIDQYGTNCSVRFEYWTCGTFDEGAIEKLRHAAEVTRRYDIAWKDGGDIREYSKGLSATGVRRHLADHFFAHPLAPQAMA